MARPDGRVGGAVERDLGEPRPSVTPTAVDYQPVQELDRGAEQCPADPDHQRAWPLQLSGLQAGVAPRVADRLAPTGGEQVDEIAIERLHDALGYEPLVYRARLIVAVAPPAQQPMTVLGVLRRGAERAAQEDLAQRQAGELHTVGRICEEALDLTAQLWAHALVGVDLEHPVPGRMIDCDVALSGEAQPGLFDDACARGPRDLDRRVGRARVHEHDLVAEANAGKAVGEALLLGAGNDASRQPRRRQLVSGR